MDSNLKNVSNYVVYYNCFIKHQFTEDEGIYINNNKIRNLNRNDEKKILEKKMQQESIHLIIYMT